mmetsp:Transcript_19111/g.54874  ORF Transcript_19111/g.54874 Transcript_19111/m.54874 type:complete len:205 (+) Transcript_19111:312-926(+)
MHWFHHQQALEDLRNVAQVEGVMWPRRGRQELVATLDVKLDRPLDGGLRQRLDLLLELLEEPTHDGAKNRAHGFFARRRHAEHMRVAREPRRHGVPAATRGRRAEEQRGVLDFLPIVLLPVEEAPLILELPQKLDRRLCTILLHERHVDVIDKNSDGLVYRGSEQGLPLFFQFALNRHLRLVCLGLRGESHVDGDEVGQLLHPF